MKFSLKSYFKYLIISKIYNYSLFQFNLFSGSSVFKKFYSYTELEKILFEAGCRETGNS